MSLWAWFKKIELQWAIGNASLATGDTSFLIKAKTSLYPTKERNIPTYFQASQRLLITLSVPVAGFNSSRYTIYGEISTPSDTSNSVFNMYARDGMNVFVRNSNNLTLPFSKVYLLLHRLW